MSKLISKHLRDFIEINAVSANTVDSYGVLNEPTYLVFEPIFNFNMPSGLLADEVNVNSALAYLKRIGENARYEQLKVAIQLLKKLVIDSSWSFKSVSGFTDAYSINYDTPIISDGILKFDMHESLDMRVTAILSRIYEATFDQYRFVEVLPANLQEFSVGLLIHELRLFQDPNGYAKALLKYTDTEEPINITDINHYLLHFGKCRFLQSSGSSLFSKLDNENLDIASTNIDIEYKVFTRSYNFNVLANFNSTSEESASKNLSNFGNMSFNSTAFDKPQNNIALNNSISTSTSFNSVRDLLNSPQLTSVKNRAIAVVDLSSTNTSNSNQQNASTSIFENTETTGFAKKQSILSNVFANDVLSDMSNVNNITPEDIYNYLNSRAFVNSRNALSNIFKS
jgi:hypothetical protein